MPTHAPGHPHHLPADERVAAVRADAQVELDLPRCVGGHVADGHQPAVEVDRLGLVLEEEPDVRDEERFLHELLVEQRAAYGIDRLFGPVKSQVGRWNPGPLACLCGSYCSPRDRPSFM